MGSQDSGEAVLLKEHLREPFSDEVGVEKMLSKDQGGEVGLDVEALCAKDKLPDSLLVAFLCWQQVEQRREVTAVVHLIPTNACLIFGVPFPSGTISLVLSYLFSDFAFMMQFGIVLGSSLFYMISMIHVI